MSLSRILNDDPPPTRTRTPASPQVLSNLPSSDHDIPGPTAGAAHAGAGSGSARLHVAVDDLPASGNNSRHSARMSPHQQISPHQVRVISHNVLRRALYL